MRRSTRLLCWATALAAAAMLAIATIDPGAPGAGGHLTASEGRGPAAAAEGRTTEAAGKTGALPEAAAPASLGQGTSGTPALAHPATAADGFFEVRVRAGGQPLAAARVTLYLRSDSAGDWRESEPAAAPRAEAAFRFAGAGETAPDGQIRLPTRPASSS